jgi:RNA polymerase sigma-70 factor (ECF subfamily)
MADSASTIILETLTLRGKRAAFPTTQWELVARSTPTSEPADGAALAELCRLYWPPIYAFLRRQGHDPATAQDHAQSFFERVIAQDVFGAARPERGRLRTFLLTALRHHVADTRRRARAQKRGGGEVVLSIDAEEAEGHLGNLPTDTQSPDHSFEQAWAARLLEHVHALTRERYARIGKEREFTLLEPYLDGLDKVPYPALAEQLNLSEAGVRVLLHRMRRRFRAVLEEEIASTVSSREDAEDELRHLFRVLGR